MRKILAIFKTPTIRTALFCAVFCATTLCPAQETARGIVAEKIDTVQNGAERAEPEIRFVEDYFYDDFISISSDLKFIVFSENSVSKKTYHIVDFATGYVLRTISLPPHNYAETVGISEDNAYIKISYDDKVYIYSVETGQQVSDVNQNFIYLKTFDKENETCPFIDDEELSNKWSKWLYNEKNLYISERFTDADFFVFDANTRKKYSFSFYDTKIARCMTYIDKKSDFISIAAAYDDGHITRYSTRGEVLNIYDFDGNDTVRTIEQQDEFLIAYGEDAIYIYNLYSGKLLKRFSTDENGFDRTSYNYSYLNFHDEYLIAVDSSCCITKLDLRTNEFFTKVFKKDIDASFSSFKYADAIHIKNLVYFLLYDKDGNIIIETWDFIENKMESIWTGISFSDLNDTGFYLHYNENKNLLYMNIYNNDSNICILKYDLITKQCSAYYPENGYPSITFVYADNFDTVILCNDDLSLRAVVNLKDFTLIEHSDFLKEKVKEFFAVDEKPGYIYALTTRNTVCKYNNKGKCVAEYENQEEFRKSKDYFLCRHMTEDGVTASDFYGELYHVQFVQNGESLIYTPEGFFCGSEWATQNLVYIVDGMDVIGIDQVYDTYYRPDLVAAKMRGEDISAYASSVRLASLVRSGRAPAVSLLGIPAESSGRDMTFDISVRNTGGGIGAVNLLLNGKSIRLSDGVTAADGETISFRHTVTLQNGSNTLEAFALNGAGLVESVRSSAQVVWRGATEKPDLYVLTAAVNRYRDKSLWLNYAVPDAQSVAAGFQKQKSGLYRNVHVSQLNDSEVTKEKLAAEFSRLSQHIRADDVFVFFVSGHGTTYDDGDYYYLPSDFRYTSKDSIPNGGISKNDLLANLSKIKAGKTLVMLDTCNSGAFLSDSNKRGLSEKTAIDRLTRATGHATLAASSDTQSAMEGYNGHGVFTYVFLEGIAGAADSDGDGYVTLNELSAFVEREVPERSYEKWGYEQVPQKDLRRQDFPIAGK